MSERFKEHAWKSTLSARADAHEIPPTHSRSTASPNIDTRRHVLLNHRVDRGLRGYVTTVLTQNLIHFRACESVLLHATQTHRRTMVPRARSSECGTAAGSITTVPADSHSSC